MSVAKQTKPDVQLAVRQQYEDEHMAFQSYILAKIHSIT